MSMSAGVLGLGHAIALYRCTHLFSSRGSTGFVLDSREKMC